MSASIFGNSTAEKILLYMESFGEGYAAAIAETYAFPGVSMVQRQLERLERSGPLVNTLKGRTRMYTWNPRYPFLTELRALLRKEIQYLPAEERRRYFTRRRRPRRTGKPL
jgi:hypothetical protein